jgi:asparagine synthase (glutamine-hydrolysing)
MLLRGGFFLHLSEMISQAASARGLELRLPYLDLRLIRFLASVPWDHKEKNGKNKILLREAMRDLLPSEIRQRIKKSEFTPVIRPAMKRTAWGQIREAFEKPHPALGSMVIPEKLEPIYRRCFPAGPFKPSQRDLESFWFLWYIVSVDQWLKHRSEFEKRLQEVEHEECQEESARRP